MATAHVAREAPDSALIESVCERVRERVGAEEVAEAEAFVRQYYRRAPPEDLAELRAARPLRRRARALELRAPTRARHAARARLQPDVRAARLAVAAHGRSRSSATTCRSSSTRRRWSSAAASSGIHVLVHPVIRVRRTRRRAGGGARRRRRPTRASWRSRSCTSRSTARARRRARALRERLLDVLGRCAAAVEDWQPMRDAHADADRRAREPPPRLDRDECRGGARAARVDRRPPLHVPRLPRVRAGHGRRRRLHAPVEGSGLGLLRERRRRVDAAFAKLPPARARARARAAPARPHQGQHALDRAPAAPTSTTSASSASTPTATWSASGASSASTRRRAYRAVAGEIPVLRRKVAGGASSAPASRPAATTTRRWSRSSTRYPRDELFQIAEDELFEIAIGHPRARRAPARAAVHAPRPLRALRLLPRLPARATASTRANRERDPARSCARRSAPRRVDFELRLSESVLVRIHFTLRLRPGARARRRRGRARGADRRGDRLVGRRPARGAARGGRRGARAPRCTAATATRSRPATATSWLARSAVADIQRIERLDRRRRARRQPLPPARGAAPARCAASSTAAASRVSLSDVLPMFESMGLRVRDERPYRGHAARRPADVDLRLRRSSTPATASSTSTRCASASRTAFARVWRGDVEKRRLQRRSSSRAGLDWREVTMLRAFARYLRQARHRRSATATWSRRCSPIRDVAAALVELFRARFDPAGDRDAEPRTRSRARSRRRSTPSTSLDEDRILRGFLARRARRCCAPTTSSGATAHRSRTCRSSSTRTQVPLLPAAAPALRDLRVLAAGRGRAPARRRGRARRPALVGPPRGLPHRGPRPDEGADGQERGDRAGRREGRLRGQAPAGGPRALATRSSPATGRSSAACSTSPTTSRGGAVVPPAARRAPRRRRPVPRRRRRQGHGDVLRHRQRDRGGVRLLARRRVRVRRLGRLRPQGDGHHRARRVGVGQAPLPRARASTSQSERLHRRRASATCRATCSATACCCRRTSGSSPRSTTATCSSTPTPTRRASFAERARLFELPRSSWADYDRSLISEGGGVFPRTREVDRAVAAGARGARDRRRAAHADAS